MGIFGLAMLLFVGLFILVGALKGRSRGLINQSIRLAGVITALVISIIITGVADNIIFKKVAELTPDEIIDFIESYGLSVRDTGYETIINNVEPETANYIIAIPLALVVMPLLFIIIFEIIKLFMLIPHAIICGATGFTKKRNTWLTRLLGAGVGALQGMLVAVVILCPFTGIFSMAEQTVEALEEEAPDSEVTITLSELYNDYAKEYTEDPVIKTAGFLGGNAMYSTLSKVQIKGESYQMAEYVREPVVQMVAVSTHLGDFDWENPTDENIEAFKEAMSILTDNKFTNAVIIEVLNVASETYNEGGISVEGNQMVRDLFDASMQVCGKTSNESLKNDVITLLEAYYILGSEGAVSAFANGGLEEVRTALTKPYYPEGSETGTTVVSAVSEKLNSNENTVPLVSAISKITISALADALHLDEDAQVIYEDVKGGISDVLAIDKETMEEEEYKAKVSEEIDAVLSRNDITLEKDVVDEMANYVSENYDTLVKTDEDGNKLITDEEINHVIISYYDAYVAAGGTFDGELPEDIEIPSGLDIPQ